MLSGNPNLFSIYPKPKNDDDFNDTDNLKKEFIKYDHSKISMRNKYDYAVRVFGLVSFADIIDRKSLPERLDTIIQHVHIENT